MCFEFPIWWLAIACTQEDDDQPHEQGPQEDDDQPHEQGPQEDDDQPHEQGPQEDDDQPHEQGPTEFCVSLVNSLVSLAGKDVDNMLLPAVHFLHSWHVNRQIAKSWNSMLSLNLTTTPRTWRDVTS